MKDERGRWIVAGLLAGAVWFAGGQIVRAQTTGSGNRPPVSTPSTPVPLSTPHNPFPNFPSSQTGFEGMDRGAMGDRMESRRARSLSLERQKKMVSDSNKLLALATEVKVEVAQTTNDHLPGDVLKKTEEIEKLAKGVRERMKGQ